MSIFSASMIECAGLAKLFEGKRQGWHITEIRPHHFVQCGELAWLIFARYGESEQTAWIHITGSEVLAHALECAK